MNELLQPLSEIKPRALHWLWAKNMCLGKLALLDGDPGLGKSLVAMDLCARLSTGRPFPGSETPVEPADAIILNAEDDAFDCVRPRLEAMGADLSRIHILRQDYLDKHDGFSLPSHTEMFAKAVADIGARLVVIDPITAFLDPAVNICCEKSVRAALAPLSRLATLYEFVALLIRHITKMLGAASIYRGLGSIAFQAACRSSFLVGRDAIHRERIVMASVKNNYAALQPALAYEIVGQGDAAVVNWLGTSKLSANQLLAFAGHKADLPGPVERACEFLTLFLQAGPRPTTMLWPEAQKLGFSRSTLRRARKRCKIRFELARSGERNLTFWILPGQKLPDGVGADTGSDLQDLWATIEEQFPTTPLDGI
ncbi:MAG TPA: AAA family ATPase [Gemmataceae bacterium]|jgi:hypothetical protein|nr:AAA family ATPase [Gemmataceae bacterium]